MILYFQSPVSSPQVIQVIYNPESYLINRTCVIQIKIFCLLIYLFQIKTGIQSVPRYFVSYFVCPIDSISHKPRGGCDVFSLRPERLRREAHKRGDIADYTFAVLAENIPRWFITPLFSHRYLFVRNLRLEREFLFLLNFGLPPLNVY